MHEFILNESSNTIHFDSVPWVAAWAMLTCKQSEAFTPPKQIHGFDFEPITEVALTPQHKASAIFIRSVIDFKVR